jgi:hypothetical protein
MHDTQTPASPRVTLVVATAPDAAAPTSIPDFDIDLTDAHFPDQLGGAR